LAAYLTVFTFERAALACPPVGAFRPEAKLTDAWGRSIHLGSFGTKPLVVVYEDKSSAQKNAALKADLTRLTQGKKYRATVTLVAVADVSDYDFWPARGFAKDAIKAASRKQNIVIYCDWDGRVREKLRLNKNESNIVLYGKDGKVAFSRAGKLSAADRAELIKLLRRQADNSAMKSTTSTSTLRQ